MLGSEGRPGGGEYCGDVSATIGSGAEGAVTMGFAMAKVGSTTLGSCKNCDVSTLVSCMNSGVVASHGSHTGVAVTGGCTTTGAVASVMGKVQDCGELLCNAARASRSWTRVGATKFPVRLNCFQAREKSFIAAMSISFASGVGGVTAVSGNHATVSVMRGEHFAVANTW